MGNTIMGAVVSLDGYIADTNGNVGPLFDWYGNGDVEWKFTEHQEEPCRTSKASGDRATHLLCDVECTAFQGEAARC